MIKFAALFFSGWYLMTLLFPGIPGGPGESKIKIQTVVSEDTSFTQRFILREKLLYYIKHVVNPGMGEYRRSLLADSIIHSSVKYGINPYLVLGIVYIESNGNEWAVNGGSYGVMQVMPKWWDKKLRAAGVIRHEEDYYSAVHGIEAGCYVLRDCLQRAGGDVRKALAYYSGSRSKKYADKALTFVRKENQ